MKSNEASVMKKPVTFRWYVAFFVAVFVFFGLMGSAFAQNNVSERAEMAESTEITLSLEEPYSYYMRLMQLSGDGSDRTSFLIRPVGLAVRTDGQHPWKNRIQTEPLWEKKSLFLAADLTDPVYFSSYNTELPAGGNDGLLWQGRGMNRSVSLGAKVQVGPFHLQLRPVYTQSANLDFELFQRNQGRYETPFRGIVQRFGEDRLSELSWGDSFAAVRMFGVETAVGNSRMWIGPATTYPLLFGTNAPGFLHGRVGTYRPLNIGIGFVEGHYIAGRLEGSEFSSIHTRSLNALVMSFTPRWIPGLSLGVQRMFVDYYPDNLKDLVFYKTLFQVLFKEDLADEETGDDGSQPDNQILSLYGRWAFPARQFEVYGTFVVNDHRTDARDLRAHPDHAAYWNFGMIKLFERSARSWVAVNFEVTELEDTRTSIARGWPNPNRWASIALTNHSSNPFNHKGTPIGSMVGPSGNALILRVDHYSESGRWGLRLNRHNYMNSLLHNQSLGGSLGGYSSLSPLNREVDTHDIRQTEIQTAIETTQFLPWFGLEVDAGLEFTHRMNYNFIYQNDIDNWRFLVALRKVLPGRRW